MHYFSLSSIDEIVFINVFFFYKEYSPSFRDLESPGAPGSSGIGILGRGRDNKPPIEKPPVHKPPVEKPPVHKSPVEKLPVYKPPVEKPPIYKPPVEKPTVYKPPVEKSPTYKPPSPYPHN
ncbi:hypothetical protein Pint_14642 [Pistacia integerrima]|uniref:Uncharacterized protein n=1 Tax=Pistacia integerrima TaxID=434235 RepID=A0ACC0Y744_9ROSI|nr:hypothetical protein Pint_14642 [Pistacia integerrima]